MLEVLASRGGFAFDFAPALIGGAALDAVDDPFPAATLASCQGSDSVLLACIGGPKWDANARDKRPETGLLAMRKSMNLFANLRPAKVVGAACAACWQCVAGTGAAKDLAHCPVRMRTRALASAQPPTRHGGPLLVRCCLSSWTHPRSSARWSRGLTSWWCAS